MSKKVTFSAKPLKRPTPDQWVADQPVGNEPYKRLTIDITPALHKRIKVRCASLDQKMADVIRDLLEKEFPAE